MTTKEIWAELDAIKSEINNLYWTYTRTARGKPPILVRPDLYARQKLLMAAVRVKGRARALLLATVIAACGTGPTPTPPDAPPLPTCADLGCTGPVLCSSRQGPCVCNGQTCDPARPTADLATGHCAP